jgi:hypothetical protein
MTTLNRVKTTWSGLAGGAGVSTFYSLDGVSMAAGLVTFWNGIKAALPIGLHLIVESAGDSIDAATGALVGSWGSGSGTGVDGTGTGAYSLPSGMLVKWTTGVVLDGSRVVGKTFIVPIVAAAYDANGTIADANITELTTKAAALVTATSPDFVVWHRPFAGSPAVGARPARAAHVGAAAIVTGSGAPDKCVVLRSRRD